MKLMVSKREIVNLETLWLAGRPKLVALELVPGPNPGVDPRTIENTPETL